MEHNNSHKRKSTAGVIVALILTVCAGFGALAARVSHARQQNTDHKVRVVAEQTLPQLEGGKLKATLVEVTYAPGAGSSPHSHPCPVIGYVVSGELRTQVKGSAEARYKAGETFYEPPNGVHLVSANASKTEPAKLLAIFVCDHEVELSTPVHVEGHEGKE